MLRFVAGFASATALFSAFLVAYSRGLINIDLEPEREPAELAAVDLDESENESTDPKKKRRARRGGGRRYSGNSLTGDDLGGPDTRNLHVANAGGEQQLLGPEIERGFDSAFPQVRRCLMLAAGDEPVTGKIVFGLRITGQGQVSKVNLQGPSAITQSEAGDCLRKAALGIRFRSFNGPDMLVHFPLTLN